MNHEADVSHIIWNQFCMCWNSVLGSSNTTRWDYNIPVQCQELLQWETWHNGSDMPSTQQVASAKTRLFTVIKIRILGISQRRQFYHTKRKEWIQKKRLIAETAHSRFSQNSHSLNITMQSLFDHFCTNLRV